MFTAQIGERAMWWGIFSGFFGVVRAGLYVAVGIAFLLKFRRSLTGILGAVGCGLLLVGVLVGGLVRPIVMRLFGMWGLVMLTLVVADIFTIAGWGALLGAVLAFRPAKASPGQPPVQAKV